MNDTKTTTKWKPGQSGNPNGRPLGSRHKLSESVLQGLATTWAAQGSDVLEKVARDEPSKFLAVVASLIPRDVQLSISARLPGNLEPDDWLIVNEVVAAIRAELPDVRHPGDVLAYVRDAIRAHSAPVVIDSYQLTYDTQTEGSDRKE